MVNLKVEAAVRQSPRKSIQPPKFYDDAASRDGSTLFLAACRKKNLRRLSTKNQRLTQSRLQSNTPSNRRSELSRSVNPNATRQDTSLSGIGTPASCVVCLESTEQHLCNEDSSRCKHCCKCSSINASMSKTKIRIFAPPVTPSPASQPMRTRQKRQATGTSLPDLVESLVTTRVRVQLRDRRAARRVADHQHVQEITAPGQAELAQARERLRSGQAIVGQPSATILQQYQHDVTAALLHFADATCVNIYNDQFMSATDQQSSSECTIDDADEQMLGDDGELLRALRDIPPVSISSMQQCATKFAEQCNPLTRIDYCASCGIKVAIVDIIRDKHVSEWSRSMAMHQYPIEKLSVLQTIGSRRARYQQSVWYRKHMTIYKHRDGRLYDLHSSLLTSDEHGAVQASLCVDCEFAAIKSKKPSRPKYNVGNGKDFGLHANLPTLTHAERKCISRCIGFQDVAKFVTSSTGHLISFPTTAADQMACQLPRTDLTGILRCAFIGTKASWDEKTATVKARKLFFKRYPQIVVRQEVVCAWLVAKQQLDSSYQDIDICLDGETLAQLGRIQHQLLDETLVVENEYALEVEMQSKSNVARPEVEEQNAARHLDKSGDEEEPMEHVCVQDPVVAATATREGIIKAVRAALGSTDADEVVQLPVGSLPVNEFEENDQLWLGTYPDLFLLGEGMPSGILAYRDIKHLLLQHDNRFACNHRFLYGLFNQMQRTAAARSVSMRVKNHHRSMEKFIKLVNNESFQADLAEAESNPKSSKAAMLVNTLIQITKLSGGHIPWSKIQRNEVLPRTLAMSLYLGSYSFFVTISPSDMDSGLMLRLAHLAARNEVNDDLHIPLPTWAQRMKLLAANPVAAAQSYIALIEAVFEHLVGLAPDHLSRTSHPPSRHRKEGLFGVPKGYVAVTELQGRGSAHCHFLVATDVAPEKVGARKIVHENA